MNSKAARLSNCLSDRFDLMGVLFANNKGIGLDLRHSNSWNVERVGMCTLFEKTLQKHNFVNFRNFGNLDADFVNFLHFVN